MENSLEFGDKCLDHEDHTIQFVCLNVTCSQTALGCVMCFKKNHSTCNRTLILDRALLDRLLEVRPAENLQQLKLKIKECLDKDFANLKNILQKKKETIMLQFKPFEEDVSKLTPEQIIAYKKYSDIKLRNDGKIEFQNRIKSSEEIKEDLDRFQKLIRQKLDLHLRIYRNLKFENHKKLYQDDFLCHKNIQLTEVYNGLIIRRSKCDIQDTCIIMKEPLENINLKLTLFKHQKNQSYKFGVFDQNQFQKYHKTLQINYPKTEGIFQDYQFNNKINFDHDNQIPQNLDEMNQKILYITYKSRAQTISVKTGDGKVNEMKKINSEHGQYFFLVLNGSENQQFYLQKY